jgi:hypothetical protein
VDLDPITDRHGLCSRVFRTYGGSAAYSGACAGKQAAGNAATLCGESPERSSGGLAFSLGDNLELAMEKSGNP